jgi:hypothetical protein
MTQIKQVVEVPSEEFNEIIETGRKILKALENLNLTAPAEYLTPGEFMVQTKMSRWKFDALRADGKLQVIQRGRKLYVNRHEISRYFAGEMES